MSEEACLASEIFEPVFGVRVDPSAPRISFSTSILWTQWTVMESLIEPWKLCPNLKYFPRD